MAAVSRLAFADARLLAEETPVARPGRRLEPKDGIDPLKLRPQQVIDKAPGGVPEHRL